MSLCASLRSASTCVCPPGWVTGPTAGHIPCTTSVILPGSGWSLKANCMFVWRNTCTYHPKAAESRHCLRRRVAGRSLEVPGSVAKYLLKWCVQQHGFATIISIKVIYVMADSSRTLSQGPEKKKGDSFHTIQLSLRVCIFQDSQSCSQCLRLTKWRIGVQTHSPTAWSESDPLPLSSLTTWQCTEHLWDGFLVHKMARSFTKICES